MHLEKRGFVIFLQWPTFWDFNDTRLPNYIPSGIRSCFPLFWGIFLGLGPAASRTIREFVLFKRRHAIKLTRFSLILLIKGMHYRWYYDMKA